MWGNNREISRIYVLIMKVRKREMLEKSCLHGTKAMASKDIPVVGTQVAQMFSSYSLANSHKKHKYWAQDNTQWGSSPRQVFDAAAVD